MEVERDLAARTTPTGAGRGTPNDPRAALLQQMGIKPPEATAENDDSIEQL